MILRAVTGRDTWTLVMAFTERMVPRLGSMLLMLCLAIVATPSVVGAYIAGVVLLTLVQAAGDVAVRQIGTEWLRHEDGAARIRRMLLWNAVAAPSVMWIGFQVLVVLHVLEGKDAIWFALLSLVPVVQSKSLGRILQMQVAGQWNALARNQAVASAVSLAICVPAVLSSASVWAAAGQVLLLEIGIAVLAYRNPYAEHRPKLRGAPRWRSLLVASSYSTLSWGQTQLDRVLVAGFAGTAATGAYGFASAVGRSVGDALSAGMVNVLRSQLMDVASTEAPRFADRAISRAIGINIVVSGAIVVLAVPLLDMMLGSEWDSALGIIPILALSAPAATLAWGSTVILVRRGVLALAIPVRAVGVLASIGVAGAFSVSLELGAWTALGREVTLSVLIAACSGRWFPVRACALSLLPLLVAGAMIWIGVVD